MNFLVYILVFSGILFRLAPHMPNFTPVMAVALFGAAYLPKRIALFLPLVIMVISDYFIRIHNLILFTWGAMFLGAVLGLGLRKKRTVKNVAGITLVSSVMFYLLTNFGVWLLSGMYEHTFQGLINCYYIALPFFRNSLLGNFIYVGILFGIYELMYRHLHKKSPLTEKA